MNKVAGCMIFPVSFPLHFPVKSVFFFYRTVLFYRTSLVSTDIFEEGSEIDHVYCCKIRFCSMETFQGSFCNLILAILSRHLPFQS